MSATGKRSRSEEDHSSSNTLQTLVGGSSYNDQALLMSLIDPDFEELASQFPSFRLSYRQVQHAQHEQSRNNNKKNGSSASSFAACITQEFSIALTKALLQTHWGISLTNVPLHHLCPPVPNRYFMVHWLQQDLLPRLLSSQHFTTPRNKLSLTGMDIGTGASCIYPLLFVSSIAKRKQRNTLEGTLDGQWKIWGSDVDHEAIEFAQANVCSNQMQQYIQSLLVPQVDQAADQHTRNGPFHQSLQAMVSAMQGSNPSYQANMMELDFCVTNPPFYDNDQERVEVRQGDGRTRTPMTVHEGTYPAGEVGFCTDILVDQCRLAISNQWNLLPGWTVVMCGKKSSFTTLHHVVSQMLGLSHVHTAEFGPGHLTRCFLAWTWQKNPHVESPLAAQESWELVLTNDEHGAVSVNDLVQRIIQFGQDYSFHVNETTQNSESVRELKLWPNETDASMVEAWALEDKLLPAKLLQVFSKLPTTVRREYLPTHGHYLLTARVLSPTTIQFHAKVHSILGKLLLNKAKQLLPGEIGRSNRKWRRRLRQTMEQG